MPIQLGVQRHEFPTPCVVEGARLRSDLLATVVPDIGRIVCLAPSYELFSGQIRTCGDQANWIVRFENEQQGWSRLEEWFFALSEAYAGPANEFGARV